MQSELQHMLDGVGQQNKTFYKYCVIWEHVQSQAYQATTNYLILNLRL